MADIIFEPAKQTFLDVSAVADTTKASKGGENNYRPIIYIALAGLVIYILWKLKIFK